MDQLSLEDLARRAERMAESLQSRQVAASGAASAPIVPSAGSDSVDMMRPIARNIRQMREAGSRLTGRLQQQQQQAGGVLLGPENISPLSEETGIRFLTRAGVDVRTLTSESGDRLRAKLAESACGPAGGQTGAMMDESVAFCDIKGWVEKNESSTIASILEETRRRTSEECVDRYWAVMEDEQARLKRKLKETLTATLSLPAAVSSQAVASSPSMGYNPLADVSILQTSTNAAIFHNRLDSDYSKIIVDYMTGAVPSRQGTEGLVARFRKAAVENQSELSIDVWDFFSDCLIPHLVVSGSAKSETIMRLRYEPTLLLEQNGLLSRNIEYLEKRFYRRISAEVAQSPDGGAVVGGPGRIEPGSLSSVRSWVSLHPPPPGCEVNSGQPVWCYAYYCMRCGDAEAAARLLNAIGERALGDYLSSDDANRSSQDRVALLQTYVSSVKRSGDIFKRALYGYVCPELDDQVLQWLVEDAGGDFEDWLYYLLTWARFTRSTKPTIATGIQQSMASQANSDLEVFARRSALAPFWALLYTGQFELAIDALMSSPYAAQYRSTALHFALLLYISNMLLVPTSTDAPLLSCHDQMTPSSYRLNIARLALNHFAVENQQQQQLKDAGQIPLTKVYYLAMLNELKNSDGDNFFSSSLADFAASNAEIIPQIFGSIDETGSGAIIDGLLSKLVVGVDVQKIVQMVACKLEGLGELQSAVRCYELSRNLDKVLELSGRIAGRFATAKPSKERLAVYNFLGSIGKRFRLAGLEHSADSSLWRSFYLLLDVFNMFDILYQAQTQSDHVRFVDTARELGLIPSSPDRVEACFANLDQLSSDVHSILPAVYLAVVTSLGEISRSIQTHHLVVQSPAGGLAATTTAHLQADTKSKLAREAHAVAKLVSYLHYRLPSETSMRINSALVAFI